MYSWGDIIKEVTGGLFKGYGTTREKFVLNHIKLLPPLAPHKIYCAGQNYRKHTIKSANQKVLEPVIPLEPQFSYRAINALIGYEWEVITPWNSKGSIYYEPEFVEVISNKAKSFIKSKATSYVLGITIGLVHSLSYTEIN